jgi:TctA family transporter
MLGAFGVHGLIPEPMLFVESANLVYAIFATMLVSCLMMLAYGYFGARPFAAILKIRKAILVPIILVVSFVGAYAVNYSCRGELTAISGGVQRLLDLLVHSTDIDGISWCDGAHRAA